MCGVVVERAVTMIASGGIWWIGCMEIGRGLVVWLGSDREIDKRIFVEN